MYTIDQFLDDIALLYQNVNDRPFKETVLPIQLMEFGGVLEGFFGKFVRYKEVEAVRLPETKNVGVAFSGGKDSAGLAFHLRNRGYDVTLYHVVNMNRAYPDERPIAERFAKEYGFGFVALPLKVPVRKGAYIENVVKNNLLIAQVLKHGLMFGITNVGLGCAFLNTSALADYGFSDSNQNLGSFGRGVEQLFGNKVLVNEMDSEGLSYRTLVEAGVSFDNIVSCMTPIRYRGRLRGLNLDKGVVIRPNGCGQCYKCAMDYYYLESFGVLPFHEKSYKHYSEILVKQWDRVFTEKPKNLREFFSHFLNKDYVNMEVVFSKLESSGVDLSRYI